MITIRFSKHFYSSIEAVKATVLSNWLALVWAWHTDETNLRCAGISRISMPNTSIVAIIVSEITAFIRTDRFEDHEYIYISCGWKRFCLPVTYFPLNLVYPFTLRVLGIKTNINKLITRITIIIKIFKEFKL